MACNANQFDANCDGCRHCAAHAPDPNPAALLHHDAQAVADAKVWRRHKLERALARNRHSN
jgi:hypothetical protein